MRYAFIRDHANVFPVRRMCKVLEVHHNGYYAWRKNPDSARAIENRRLTDLIRHSWQSSGQAYGYRKVTHDLRDWGETCGKHKVARLMRLNHMRSLSQPHMGNRHNLYKNPRRLALPGEIIHSDQGSQYGSHDWLDFLKTHKFKHSMSRRGNCYDNAVAESFFQLLKRESIRRKVYTTRAEARADVFDYIEMFYNPKRRHSYTADLSPMAFEKQCFLKNGKRLGNTPFN